jgi:hypothetical protein
MGRKRCLTSVDCPGSTTARVLIIQVIEQKGASAGEDNEQVRERIIAQLEQANAQIKALEGQISLLAGGKPIPKLGTRWILISSIAAKAQATPASSQRLRLYLFPPPVFIHDVLSPIQRLPTPSRTGRLECRSVRQVEWLFGFGARDALASAQRW